MVSAIFTEGEAPDAPCPECGQTNTLRLEWRDGTFVIDHSASLAGSRVKFVARLTRWPFLVCRTDLGGCGDEIIADVGTG